MISEFYVFLAVIAVAVILMAVAIIAIFVEIRKSRQGAGEPTE
jgi:hypothetical protein